MSNEASRFFSDAVWRDAFELYEKECGGNLCRAPKWVQDKYVEKARYELRDYLATFGIV